LFYSFSLEQHVPTNHLLRLIDRFAEFSELRRELSAFYGTIGRPSIAPELMRSQVPRWFWRQTNPPQIAGAGTCPALAKVEK
jgi:hypothetical protein